MSWYLQHFFDPELDYQQLKPAENATHGSDLYNLCYVQNVIAGQLLAQIVPLESVKDPKPKYVLASPKLPGGANTITDTAHNYLLAACNGYVFYLDGKITVKKTLNVRQDISFATGNIFFVGDMCVHGSVRAGFEVQANNILIKEMVEGGSVRARKDLAIVGGARGGAGQHCILDAGGTLRSSFIEKLEARARGTIFIEKSCLYTTVYAGANMVVQERMHGCVAHIYSSLVVGQNLGNSAAIPTRVYMGYTPTRMWQLERLQQHLDEVLESITHLTAVAGHLPPDANETTRKLANQIQVRDHLWARRNSLWESLQLDEMQAKNCRLIVRGTVYPGVDIGIGKAMFTVTEKMDNVQFTLQDDEVIVQPAHNRV